MSEQQSGQHRGNEGESEGFLDRVKDFFGIRDDHDATAAGEVEYDEAAGGNDEWAPEDDEPVGEDSQWDVEDDEALGTEGTPSQPVHEAVGEDSDSAAEDDPEVVDDESAEDDLDYDPKDLEKALDDIATAGPVEDEPEDQAGAVPAGDREDEGSGREAPSEEHHAHDDMTPQADDGDTAEGEATAGAESEVDLATGADVESDAGTVTEADADSAADPDGEAETSEAESDEERARREEEFAREHDPEHHDVAAGAQFRQPGDWTAEEHGGPQVQDSSGTIHEPGSAEAEQVRTAAEEAPASGDDAAAEDAGIDGDEDAGSGTVESSIEEVRDGGHGVGSAAPLPDGRQPFGHPIKAWTDTMTFVLPGEPGYDAPPHEWFTDADAAERAGFRHAHGA